MAGRRLLFIAWMLISLGSGSVASVFGQTVRPQAPELRVQACLNTAQLPEQLTLATLKGHVVVLVFFLADEQEPNSPAALDQACQLWNAYHERGLVVLGVHSPPPDWLLQRIVRPDASVLPLSWPQRAVGAVQALIDQHRVSFPILLDHDRYVWDRYRNSAYPTFQMISADGTLQVTVVGTQGYQALSRQVDIFLRDQARAQADQARNAAAGPPQ